ncbi:MAG: MFS transporter [Alphaproteobacteria bacterium]|nr:MFS transporter [Alphaproteobacteria bacterium]
MAATGEPAIEAAGTGETSSAYAKYVLGVLVIVYVINFIDRQILSILAEEIKADLGISDSQIGFLYGTAFAVFYAVFGVPLGRLADVWIRTRIIAIGLAFWSVMTALSGFARSFGVLAICRFGVGVGEAAASPAANSLLFDYFPPKMRATALAIYSSGIYIGAGIGIFLGGAIVDGWNGMFPDPAAAPLGLSGWHVAFLAVGAPGLLIALWAGSLREPERGRYDGIKSKVETRPLRAIWRELVTILPPFTVFGLRMAGGTQRELTLNLVAAAGFALGAYLLTLLLGSALQWFVLAIGLYAFFSWSQSLALRDKPTFRLIFRSRAFLGTVIGFACISFVTYGTGFWAVPYLIRAHGVSASEVGLYAGLGAAIGGFIGVSLGGILADMLMHRIRAARHVVGMVAFALALPVGIGILYADTMPLAYTLMFLFSVFSPMWIGPATAATLDLVLPRMRAVANAISIFMNTLIGLALGPYAIGRISDGFIAGGMAPADSLRYAMMLGMIMLVLAIAILVFAVRHLDGDMARKNGRALEAGEPIQAPA